MLAGIYHKLTVSRISDHGLYLADEEGEEVLLPNRYVSLEDKPGDTMEVFVYHDSEDRLIATTEHPYATVGQADALKVVDKTVHGAFLDWGITAKDLFLPNRNMIGRLDPGQRYVVYVYRDNVTGRAVATMNYREYIKNTDLTLKRGQEVDILVALRTEGGYRVIINNQNWGMIYNNQLFGNIEVGDRLKAYVRKITDDNRVDLSLQQEGYDEVKKSADRLLDILKENGGSLPLNDSSDPERVTELTRMSKKVFKRTVGYLLKRNNIEMDEKGISLKDPREAGSSDERPERGEETSVRRPAAPARRRAGTGEASKRGAGTRRRIFSKSDAPRKVKK